MICMIPLWDNWNYQKRPLMLRRVSIEILKNQGGLMLRRGEGEGGGRGAGEGVAERFRRALPSFRGIEYAQYNLKTNLKSLYWGL